MGRGGVKGFRWRQRIIRRRRRKQQKLPERLSKHQSKTHGVENRWLQSRALRKPRAGVSYGSSLTSQPMPNYRLVAASPSEDVFSTTKITILVVKTDTHQG